MSTYREIIGKKIKKVSSDPSSGTEGEMWYNSTTGTLRGPAILSAWTSCGPLISVQGDMANVGTQTASLCAGGSNNPGSENVNITQEGNGTGFSQGGNLNTERRGCAGFGVQTSAVCFGGYTTTYDNNTEEYNGTAWTNGNDTPLSPGTASWNSGGTLTAGLGYGGSDLGPGATPPANRGKQTIEYDGTNWADGNQMTRTSGDGMTGFGIQTAALAAGQSTPPGSPSATTVVENYDGTNWTSGTVTPAGVAYCGSGGTQTAGIIFGGVSDGSPGYPTKVTTTLSWDGTSWSAEPALATARMGTWGGPVGSSTASQLMGGNSGPGVVANVENFDSSTTAVTSAVWASGNNLNTVRTLGGSAIPTVSDGIVFGGSGYTNVTEQYDGTTWTEKGDLNTARGYISGFGTSTAAVAAGGYTAPNNPQSLVEEFNGSAWSEETNLPASRKSAGNCGTLTAGLIMGGSTAQPYAANVVNTAFEYNGTSWTATPGNLPEAKGQGMSGGTQTAAYYAAGRIPPNTYTQKTAEYNGSSFSEGGDVVTISETTAQGAQGATGTQTAGLATGGQPAKTNTYDGTTWATTANFNTGRNKGMGGGTATAALIAGGGAAPGNTAATEEFTAATTAVNVKTLTQS